MTDRGSSPEPDYPWTRYHRSEEQTTRDPDHWNASNRSRSGSEDRDPNDDPYTYRRATPEPVQIQVTHRTYTSAILGIVPELSGALRSVVECRRYCSMGPGLCR